MSAAPCWAHRRGWDGQRGVVVAASYCWHGIAGRYPLCAECATRWRSYRDPVRLHTLERS
jgi:hypothetical protein